MSNGRRKKEPLILFRGFTIIELMVVISIIGMLSSVILASFQTVRDKARIAVGLQFERHTIDAFGDKILALYDFENLSCVSKNITIKNSMGSSALDLLPSNWATECIKTNANLLSRLLSADTPTEKGNSFKFTSLIGNYHLPKNASEGGNKTGISFTNFSVGFWLKTDTPDLWINNQDDHIEDIILPIVTATSANFSLTFRSNHSPLGLNYDNSNLIPSNLLFDSKWHYVFISFKPTYIKAYLDGKLINTINSINSLSEIDVINKFDLIAIFGLGFGSRFNFLLDDIVFIGDGI